MRTQSRKSDREPAVLGRACLAERHGRRMAESGSPGGRRREGPDHQDRREGRRPELGTPRTQNQTSPETVEPENTPPLVLTQRPTSTRHPCASSSRFCGTSDPHDQDPETTIARPEEFQLLQLFQLSQPLLLAEASTAEFNSFNSFNFLHAPHADAASRGAEARPVLSRAARPIRLSRHPARPVPPERPRRHRPARLALRPDPRRPRCRSTSLASVIQARAMLLLATGQPVVDNSLNRRSQRSIVTPPGPKTDPPVPSERPGPPGSRRSG
jgi:hypothetical protein